MSDSARQDRVLDDLPRLPARLLPDAHRGPALACRGASTPIPAGMGLELPNLLSSIGAFVVALAVLLFVVNLRHVAPRRRAWRQPNPWGATIARMGDEFAAAAVQLRPPARSSKAARRCGTQQDELSGRSRPAGRGSRAAADDASCPRQPGPARAERRAQPLAVHRGARDDRRSSSRSIFSPWALVIGAVPAGDRADRLVLAEEPEPKPEPVIS